MDAGDGRSLVECAWRGGAGCCGLAKRPPRFRKAIDSKCLTSGRSNLTDLTFDHVEAVRSLLNEGKSGKTIQLPGRLHVSREFNRLVIADTSEVAPEFNYDLPIPGSVRVPELGRVFRATCIAGPVMRQALPKDTRASL